jgi:hypothetical protein
MTIPAPPAKPACEGADPTVFDQTHFQNTSLGLGMCERCPVRAWCLETVDPANGNFDGIAGGHVWVDGKIKWAIPGDEIATNYLERRNINTVHHQRFDTTMIKRFTAGEVHRLQLNRAERIAAAQEIYRQGSVTIRELAEHVGVPKTTLTKAIDVDPDKVNAAYRTVRANIEAIQESIPDDRFDNNAIAEFMHRQRRWYTLNVRERSQAARQMVAQGWKHVSQAIDVAHITREQYEDINRA